MSPDEDTVSLELVDEEAPTAIPPSHSPRSKRRRVDGAGSSTGDTTAPAPAPAPAHACSTATRSTLGSTAACCPLRGVSIAISGIQNPRRSKLREIALRLGATYSGTWDERNTTHLICAFAGTPKFNEVSASGKGTIVRPEWLEECDNEGHRLSEADFVVHGARSSGRLQRNSADPNRSTANAVPAGKRAQRSNVDSAAAAAAGGATAALRATIAPAPASAGLMTTSTAELDKASVDSGEETEDLDNVLVDAGSTTTQHSLAPSTVGDKNEDADKDGWASDSTEQLDDAEIAHMHASYSDPGDPDTSAASAGQAGLRWSCAGLADCRLSLPDFFQGITAYLPRTEEWSSQQQPLDYRSVLRMLIANGAEVLTSSSDCATHHIRHVDASWVYACHRARRRLPAP
eukprot:COSAG02_NODE_9927_length_2072_cov_1.461733_1_plen_403_part_00